MLALMDMHIVYTLIIFIDFFFIYRCLILSLYLELSGDSVAVLLLEVL